MIRSIEGIWRDVLFDSGSRVRWDSGWRSNLIVDSCNVLLASLMKRQEGVQGILFWAVGQGERDWDSVSPVPMLGDSLLTNEVARLAISPEQIVYVNEENQPVEDPTTRLEVTAEFKGQDLVPNGTQTLREFGVFGGDATREPDSGLMIDYVIHPAIVLTPEVRLSRRLRLTFSAGSLHQEKLSGFGSQLPVTSIDGIGDEYAGALAEQSINTLAELAEIDPLLPVGNIPRVKLREFRAKALMVMRLRLSPAPFEQLAERSISGILMESPGGLAEAIGSNAVSPEMVMKFQEELAALQVALNDLLLQKITLADVMNI